MVINRVLGKCEPVNITLKDDVASYSLYTPWRVLLPSLSKVKTELERILYEDITESVIKPTDRCSPMVQVSRKSGKVRICVSLKQPNEAVKRECYVPPILDDIALKLTGSAVFSSLDASSGCWQIPLKHESRTRSTFITPLGRFCFRLLPFGISSAKEIFKQKMSELLNDLP